MTPLLNEKQIIERVFSHIDNKITDLGDKVWKEPVGGELVIPVKNQRHK